MDQDQKIKLVSQLATQLLSTQLQQIRLWKADDVDLRKLEDLSVDIATNLVEKASKVER